MAEITLKTFSLDVINGAYLYLTNNEKFNESYNKAHKTSIELIPTLKNFQQAIVHIQEVQEIDENIKDLFKKKIVGAKEMFNNLEILTGLIEDKETSLWAADKCLNYVYNSKPLFAVFYSICTEITLTALTFLENHLNEIKNIENDFAIISSKAFDLVYKLENKIHAPDINTEDLSSTNNRSVVGDTNINYNYIDVI